MNAAVYLKEIMVEGKIISADWKDGADILNRPDERFITVTGAKVYEYDNDLPIATLASLFINKDAIIYVKPVKEDRNE